AADAYGGGMACIDACVEYAKTREQFGVKIGSFQALKHQLADMAVELDASRLLTYRAATLRESGARFSAESAMAKLHASEMAGRVTDLALQLHGGYGYARRLPLERHARDARIMRIYEGASEVQRNIIARALLR
ncbi:MAG: acyl-CoA dehydrogenase family protein, partial [Candidatus Brocadiia bacterium]|nr:acyl-CoA dehydrogenase family protein [Candidatus Brocadiia bacterium]